MVDGPVAAEHREKVNAEPTKNFFVEMLVRDVDLLDAVVDLVDNSVDGARRMRTSNYQGLQVSVEFDATHFSVSDNCGGIPLAIARDYAFRFGRDEDDPRGGPVRRRHEANAVQARLVFRGRVEDGDRGLRA